MSAHPVMILQRPDVIAFLSESQRVFRLVYLDGRGHPEDLADYPEWTGSSIGRWEGDTLVVDTRGINDRTWIDTSGHEHSKDLHMTERFKLTGRDAFEYVTTYEDPVFFVKPFTTKRVFKRQIGDRINSKTSEIDAPVPMVQRQFLLGIGIATHVMVPDERGVFLTQIF